MVSLLIPCVPLLGLTGEMKNLVLGNNMLCIDRNLWEDRIIKKKKKEEKGRANEKHLNFSAILRLLFKYKTVIGSRSYLLREQLYGVEMTLCVLIYAWQLHGPVCKNTAVRFPCRICIHMCLYQWDDKLLERHCNDFMNVS